MTHPKFETQNLSVDNIEALEALFPQVVTVEIDKDKSTDAETVYKKVVDFDKLRLLLSDEAVAKPEMEHYEFTWPGKRQSILEANRSFRGALLPKPEESVNWDTTENLYIEGDNLDVLKLLRNGYMGKVKMIYIDPPYNTGSDSFVYPDDYSQDTESYEKAAGYRDDDGRKVFKTNSDTNGRYHSDWCSMMYSRLMLARALLSDDGVIFISIDDNEQPNLSKICDDIFGESNFIGCICRATGTTTGQDGKKIGSSFDYCLVYSKTASFLIKGLDLDEKDLRRFSECDDKGRYSILQLRKTGNADTRQDRPSMFYPIIAPDQSEVYPIGPTGYLSRWRVQKETYDQLVSDGMIVWKKNDISDEQPVIEGYMKSCWTPYVKYYLEGRTKQMSNLFQNIEGNKKASLVLKELFGVKGMFDNPKPIEFLKILMQISTNDWSLILDFFSGSATTAHAVMQLNAEDGGHRRFIMVQYPEPCDEKSEAYKAGYRNICEIGKERIRRAGKKIAEDAGLAAGELDIGFRVLTTASTDNIISYDKPAKEQVQTELSVNNINSERSELDLFFGYLTHSKLPLSMKYYVEKINGIDVYIVHEGDSIDLMGVFTAKELPEADIRAIIDFIAEKNPLGVVFVDNCFPNSSVKTNMIQKLIRSGIDKDCITVL